MELTLSLLLPGLILLAAFLYASVGHAGASGYLAAMALFGVAPDVMKPTALALNVLVATIASYKYLRAGCFSREIFIPLALVSIPFAFIGGMITVPGSLYKPLVGLALVFAAWNMLFKPEKPLTGQAPPRLYLYLAGGAIGLLSGLTGVGGGIYLSPLIIHFAWATTRQTSGISALFILVNSVAGLAGIMTHGIQLPGDFPLWAVAAVAGGYLGAELGSRKLGVPAIRKLLAVVLVVAGGKMFLTAFS